MRAINTIPVFKIIELCWHPSHTTYFWNASLPEGLCFSLTTLVFCVTSCETPNVSVCSERLFTGAPGHDAVIQIPFLLL